MMSVDESLLGPQSQAEEETYAIEALVFSVQVSLQKAMKRHGVSNKELAERLGMSPGRVSQIFASKGANLTLKTIARIQHALGEDFEFVRKGSVVRPQRDIQVERFKPHLISRGSSIWTERRAHNSNESRRKIAA